MNFLKKNLKKTILFMTLSCGTFECNAQYNDTVKDYHRLITAIGTVESRMNDNAKKGRYAGFLQISTVMVKECNKINRLRGKKERYTLKDRFSRKKSTEMFVLFQSYHNPKDDFQLAARLWQEGISAKFKPRRETSYTKKVRRIYEKL